MTHDTTRDAETLPVSLRRCNLEMTPARHW
jgi:hypothetical protein